MGESEETRQTGARQPLAAAAGPKRTGDHRLPLAHLALAALALPTALTILAAEPSLLTSAAFLNGKLLAAVHLFTLGFLTTTMMGALYQLLPVLFPVAVPRQRLGFLALFLHWGGLVTMAAGFGWLGSAGVAAGGSLLVTAGLIYVLHFAATLHRVPRERRGFNWTGIGVALGFYVLVLAAGLTLALNKHFAFLGGTGSHMVFGLDLDLHLGLYQVLAIHLALAIGGWVTTLSIAIGYKLIPMFSLAHPIHDEHRHLALGLVSGATLATTLIFFLAPVLPSGAQAVSQAASQATGLTTGIATGLGAGLNYSGHLGYLVALGVALIAYILGMAFFVLDSVRTLKQHKRQIDWVSWYAVTGMVALLLSLLLLLARVGLALFNRGLNPGIGVGSADSGIPSGIDLIRPAIFLALLGWGGGMVAGHATKIVPFLTWLVAFSPRVGKEKVPTMEELINRPRVGDAYALFVPGVAVTTVALLVNGLLPAVSAVALQVGLVLLAGFAWVWAWTMGEVMVRGLVATSATASPVARAATGRVTATATAESPRLRLGLVGLAIATTMALGLGLGLGLGLVVGSRLSPKTVTRHSTASVSASDSAAGSTAGSAASSTSHSTSSAAGPALATDSVLLPPLPLPNKPLIEKTGPNTVTINLAAYPKTLEIAPGVDYQAWTFNGTVPGPVLRVREGDRVTINLFNADPAMVHSIDFHAAVTPWNKSFVDVKPGEKHSYTFTAGYPGVFMYHCGSPQVIQHIANGMYGMLIVEPKAGWAPAQEFALVQGEFYRDVNDMDGMMAAQPQFTVFNGRAFRYKETPLEAAPGQRIRIFMVNAGPNLFSAFHIVGTVFDKVYDDGNPANLTRGRQTVTVPPGGGVVVELTVPQPGLYPIVTHSFADPTRGALGLLKVTTEPHHPPANDPARVPEPPVLPEPIRHSGAKG